MIFFLIKRNKSLLIWQTTHRYDLRIPSAEDFRSGLCCRCYNHHRGQRSCHGRDFQMRELVCRYPIIYSPPMLALSCAVTRSRVLLGGRPEGHASVEPNQAMWEPTNDCPPRRQPPHDAILHHKLKEQERERERKKEKWEDYKLLLHSCL